MKDSKHVQIGYSNPFMRCHECNSKVIYWHDPTRCNCKLAVYNVPCGHQAQVFSLCTTWNLVEGCTCTQPHSR